MEENLPLSTALPENTLTGGSAEGVVEGAGGSAEGVDEGADVDSQDESTYVCACSCAGAGACDARYDVCGRSWSCSCNCGDVPRVLRRVLNRLLCAFWEGSRGSNPHFNISDLARLTRVASVIQTSIDNMCNASQERNRPEAIVSDMFVTIVEYNDMVEDSDEYVQNVIDFLCGWLTLKVEDDEYSEYPWRTLIAPIFYLLVLQRLTDADSSVDRSSLLGIIIKHASPIVAQIKSKALDYVIYEPIRVHFMEIFEEKCYS